MDKFKVIVTRTAYASREFIVEAESEGEASIKALDSAGGEVFSEKDADYNVDRLERIE